MQYASHDVMIVIHLRSIDAGVVTLFDPAVLAHCAILIKLVIDDVDESYLYFYEYLPVQYGVRSPRTYVAYDD